MYGIKFTGTISYDLFKPRQENTHATLLCNFGHILHGNMMAKCIESNNKTLIWTTLGYCSPQISQEIKCPEITIPNGIVRYDPLRPRAHGKRNNCFLRLNNRLFQMSPIMLKHLINEIYGLKTNTKDKRISLLYLSQAPKKLLTLLITNNTYPDTFIETLQLAGSILIKLQEQLQRCFATSVS